MSVSADNREAAAVAAGDDVEVQIELDEDPRELTLPDDVDAGWRRDDVAGAFFRSLSYTNRKEWVPWIEEAKKPQTRAARLARTVEGLRAGRRTH